MCKEGETAQAAPPAVLPGVSVEKSARAGRVVVALRGVLDVCTAADGLSASAPKRRRAGTLGGDARAPERGSHGDVVRSAGSSRT
jgi:hypothetical protein